MTINVAKFVNAAQEPSPWDLGNRVLYDLCKAHPYHTSIDEIVAKVWIIGRAYAAAIERRKDVYEQSDDFYLDRVAPIIKNSDIDIWLEKLRGVTLTTEQSLPLITRTHKSVMNLFEQISGLNKRSLASKYLHFHHPLLFFIYDSRACNAIRLLKGITGRAPRGNGEGDNEYRKFMTKSVTLRDYIKNKFGITMTPRQLDVFLLLIEKNT